MNKILLSLMFVFALTLVSATDGYGCEPSITLNNVSNVSGNIVVDFNTQCLNIGDVVWGINVNNGTSSWGAVCNEINTTYINNSYQITTTCIYPSNFTNLTYRISAYCSTCASSVNLIGVPEIIVEENETEEPEVIVTPTPQPEKKRSSGGGGTKEVCEEWSVCADSKQTQSCNNGKIIKSRACEMPIEVIADEPTEVVQEVPYTQKVNQSDFIEEVEEESSNDWVWWLVGMMIIIAIIIGIVVVNGGQKTHEEF